MFDWIFVCNMAWMCGEGWAVAFFLFAIALLFTVGNDFMNDETKNKGIVFVLGTFMVICAFIGLAFAPNALIKSNIDRVKIKYTSPQSIDKIEKGALEVVNKLDKLIDKGVKNLDKEE